MRYKIISKRRGFTLTELAITVLLSSIVVLAMGGVLADGQKNYNRMFERVFGEVETDGYVARQTFESVVRKSTYTQSVLDGSNQYVYLFYYQSSTATSPDSYAKFYKDGTTLKVEYGSYIKATNNLSPLNTVTLAGNVTSVYFSIPGGSTCVQMVLKLSKANQSLTVTSSAIRHNP